MNKNNKEKTYRLVNSESSIRVKIKYLDSMPRLKKIVQGDWIDLYTERTVHLRAFEYAPISLGVAIEIPHGYEAIVAPRSSTFSKYSIIMTNSVGVIDESYKGDNDIWHFPALAIKDTVIPKHTRIAQFRLIRHQPTFTFKEVEKLGNKDRLGFGSTGER